MNYQHPPALTKTYDRLRNKVVLVTGASSGIGRAAALLFAVEGASVVCAARRKEKLDAVVAEIVERGGSATGVVLDVTKEDSVADAIEETVDRYGRIDGAFNNAGEGPVHGPVHGVSIEDFDRVIGVNLRGVFMCMKHQAIAMLKQNSGGAIVNTSSIGGLVGAAGNGVYSTSKWGLAGLTKCAALDYARSGIRVNAVAPGPTRTEIFDNWATTEEMRVRIANKAPMNYIAHPDDVARAALFLLSEESRWITGVVLPCEGGLSAGFGPNDLDASQ